MGSGKLTIVAALLLAACLGPRPEVGDVHLAHSERGYRVDVEVKNRAHGEGQAELTVRLRDRRTGATLQKSEKIDLQGLEQTHVIVDVDGPPADYAVEATVRFPPR